MHWENQWMKGGQLIQPQLVQGCLNAQQGAGIEGQEWLQDWPRTACMCTAV